MLEEITMSAQQPLDGAAAAARIENIYLHQGAKAAENALREDYKNSASDPAAQQRLQQELKTLQSDDKVNHVFGHISLEWAKEQTSDGSTLDRRDLKSFTRGHSTNPDDEFDRDMANQVGKQYDTLVNKNLTPDDGEIRNPVQAARDTKDYIAGNISKDSIDRLEHDYEKDRVKHETAVDSANMFLANNGELFKRIAGDHGTIDHQTLQNALQADDKETDPAKKRFRTPEERKAAQYMLDHWYDPEVSQLKDHTKPSDGDIGHLLKGHLNPFGKTEDYNPCGSLTIDSLNKVAKDYGVHPQRDLPAAPVAKALDPHAIDHLVKNPALGKQPDSPEVEKLKRAIEHASPTGEKHPTEAHKHQGRPAGLKDDEVGPGDSWWNIAKRALHNPEATPAQILEEMKRLEELNDNCKLVWNPAHPMKIKLDPPAAPDESAPWRKADPSLEYDPGVYYPPIPSDKAITAWV